VEVNRVASMPSIRNASRVWTRSSAGSGLQQ
jgi:hypothetical protein